MPFPAESFELVILRSVVEHVADPIELLRPMRPLLKPGGLSILSARTPGPHFWDDPTHVRPHTPRSLESLAEICNYEVEELRYVFAFLLGLPLRAAIFYKLMNWLPLPLGSNLIAALRKQA